MKASMAKLHDARAQLQHDLSRRVVLKFTPHLHFKLDSASERGDRVLNLMSELEIPADEPPPPTDEH
jgi:ribosome-binding factor A